MKLDNCIETPRLILRSYRDSDRDFSLSLWCDLVNGAYMSDPLMQNMDEQYLSYFDDMENDPDGYYLIAEWRDSHAPVGTFCLFPEGDSWDIGYCIARAHWREGLGSEMIEAALRWIKARGGTSVTAEVADDNAASRALLFKFGFTESKKTRFKKRNEERYFDSHILMLTWDQPQPVDTVEAAP